MRRHRYLLIVAVTVLAFLWFSRREPLHTPVPGHPAHPAIASQPPTAHGQALAPNPHPHPATTAPETRNTLFSYARPANAPALDAALSAPSRQIHYVRVDHALIAGKPSPFWQRPGAGRLVVPLPDGRALTVVIDDSEMLGPARFTSTGRIEGRPDSVATFAYNEGFLHASFEDPVLGNFVLRVATEELSQFYQVDPALLAPCGGGRKPVLDGDALAALARERARAAGAAAAGAQPAPPGIAAAANPQYAEIHVMMLHTQEVLPTLTGRARTDSIQSAFDFAIRRLNQALEASLVTARVKLVRIAETNYDETASEPRNVQDDALTALYRTTDGKMDEIHALRDEAGADIVCLALNRRDTQSSGLSFLLDSPGHPANPLFAFSVVWYSALGGTTVLAHEFGHVMGCAHDRENAQHPGAYPYSYGYRFFGADGRQYRDIMAYPPGTELSYFSSPRVTLPVPINAIIGVPAGRPGEADTALTIEQNAFAVAGYRLQTQAPAHTGALINVATRAFVGDGDHVLIGGFVVAGAQPKKMLVRAIGPALEAFGVADALTDPHLQIFAAGAPTPTAENDNWGDQRGDQPLAGDIAWAALQAGAFALPGGSRDAAVLVTLPAGPYTAVVEGVGGATGSGLIEAYEVGREGNRIVNLSTRGYADNQGREMYGGFVVQGDPGSTKRILVRVLGPTLGRAPFNMPDAMFDPFMEIRGAAGEILIENDDWSSGTTRGRATEANDFFPLVQMYSEKQIFATGFAPSNRREPCVLVDLPPGSYTVVVKPFERRDPDPQRDQPAAPGIAIVEVYEISP